MAQIKKFLKSIFGNTVGVIFWIVLFSTILLVANFKYGVFSNCQESKTEQIENTSKTIRAVLKVGNCGAGINSYKVSISSSRLSHIIKNQIFYSEDHHTDIDKLYFSDENTLIIQEMFLRAYKVDNFGFVWSEKINKPNSLF